MTEIQCRICLQYIDCMFKLDDKVKDRFIWEALNSLANVSIAVDDLLPQNVCWPCFDKLDQAIQFQQEVEKSDKVLHSNDIECITFLKSEGEQEKTCIFEDQETIFEPTIVIKSKRGRLIKQKANIYKEEVEEKQSNIKIEPKIEIYLENITEEVPDDFKSESQDTPKVQTRTHKKKSGPKIIVHRCCMCQTVFNVIEELVSHVNLTHQNLIEDNTKQTYTMKHKYQCNYCQQKFRLARSLEEHFAIPDFKEPPRDRQTEYQNRKFKDSFKEREKQSFICTYCGKILGDKQRLKIHEVRLHSNDLSISCAHPGCDKKFASTSIMKKHLKIHGEKKHVCDTCGRAFLMRKTLVSHSYLHLDVKRYQCAHCPRTFTYREMLRRHVESHFHEKLYRCDQCEKTYKWQSDLRRHIQGAHLGDLPFKCRHCSRGYFAKSSRKYHEERCIISRQA